MNEQILAVRFELLKLAMQLAQANHNLNNEGILDHFNFLVGVLEGYDFKQEDKPLAEAVA